MCKRVKIVSQLKLLAMLSIEIFKVVLRELIDLFPGFKIIKHLMIEIKPHISQKHFFLLSEEHMHHHDESIYLIQSLSILSYIPIPFLFLFSFFFIRKLY
jgi:hypothetical protein